MSERKRPEAEEAMLRLLVDDADEYERMLAEGHRELCLEYQPLIPAIVDAAVVGRQPSGELKEARDYLKECPICAESLESSSKALREIQAELDEASEGDPPSPQPVLPPVEPQEKKELGPLGQWWKRWSQTRSAMIVTAGVVLCAVALVGLVVHFVRQCAHDEAKRDKQDAGAPVVRGDAGAAARLPDAAVDPRSWLRRKGPLTFVFVNLEMVRKQHVAIGKRLAGVEQTVRRLAKAGQPTRAEVRKLSKAVDLEKTFLAPLATALKRAGDFVHRVKDDGMTPDFGAQLQEVNTQLLARRKAQTELTKRVAIAQAALQKLSKKAKR